MKKLYSYITHSRNMEKGWSYIYYNDYAHINSRVFKQYFEIQNKGKQFNLYSIIVAVNIFWWGGGEF